MYWSTFLGSCTCRFNEPTSQCNAEWSRSWAWYSHSIDQYNQDTFGSRKYVTLFYRKGRYLIWKLGSSMLSFPFLSYPFQGWILRFLLSWWGYQTHKLSSKCNNRYSNKKWWLSHSSYVCFLLLFYEIMSLFSLVIVLELLMFMVEHHTYHIKNYILHRNALKRALLLIHSKHTSLSLSSLRLLRKIIGKTDESYNNVIVKVKN